jgi:fermentation-respiration switch protein FrsA (DUF1100 family)
MRAQSTTCLLLYLVAAFGTGASAQTSVSKSARQSDAIYGRKFGVALTHVTTDDPPTILIHGDQDNAVPIQQSHQLIARLSDKKAPNRLVVRQGAKHAYPGWEADASLIADWFDAHLRRIR